MKKNIIIGLFSLLLSFNIYAHGGGDHDHPEEKKNNYSDYKIGHKEDKKFELYKYNGKTDLKKSLEISSFSTLYYIKEIHCKNIKIKNRKDYIMIKNDVDLMFKTMNKKERKEFKRVFKEYVSIIDDKYKEKDYVKTQEFCQTLYEDAVEAVKKLKENPMYNH
jgi:hypothetical protein